MGNRSGTLRAPLVQDQLNKALLNAAHNGNKRILISLIFSGAKVNESNKLGITPLMLAAKNGHSAVVTVLIHAHAIINITAQNGLTALMLAAKNGHTDTVATLIKTGAELNKTNNMRLTALMLAAKNGHTDTVAALISAGAEVNKADKQGRTALMLAIQHEKKDTALMLLKAMKLEELLKLQSHNSYKVVEIVNEYIKNYTDETINAFEDFFIEQKMPRSLCNIMASYYSPEFEACANALIFSNSKHNRKISEELTPAAMTPAHSISEESWDSSNEAQRGKPHA